MCVNPRSIYLAACLALLAQQWMKEQGMIYIFIKSLVYSFNGRQKC